MDFDFLPPALFNHVLVGYIRRYQISREPSQRGNRLALYRGMGVFNLDTSGCTKLAVCVMYSTNKWLKKAGGRKSKSMHTHDVL
jgi:hypothetical protein